MLSHSSFQVSTWAVSWRLWWLPCRIREQNHASLLCSSPFLFHRWCILKWGLDTCHILLLPLVLRLYHFLRISDDEGVERDETGRKIQKLLHPNISFFSISFHNYAHIYNSSFDRKVTHIILKNVIWGCETFVNTCFGRVSITLISSFRISIFKLWHPQAKPGDFVLLEQLFALAEGKKLP